jgi:hypothetical protein
MADNDRILMGQNNAGETGFWVSKPGSDVSTVVDSKVSTTTHWYKYQEEFDWTGAGGSSYATTDPGGSSFVSNGAGLKRTSGSPGADGGSILYFGNGSPSYIETSLDGTEQFLGSTYTVVEMRIRANTSATSLPATSENDLKLTWDAFPLGEASPVNFHAGNLTGNGFSAGYSREKLHGNPWGKTFLDDGWIVLEWDMSGVQAWTDPNAYMQSLDGGANLHPPSIHYRINKLKFELTENDYTGTIDPLWEIDYVRVKKAGVGPSAGRQSQSFVKELAYDFDATHSAMVHQTGTVICGTNLAWRDGKTSNRRGNDITVDHGVDGKGEIDIIPPLPYIPVIIFQRVETSTITDNTIPANESVSTTVTTDSFAYPGGEKEFSHAIIENSNWGETPAGFITSSKRNQTFYTQRSAEIRTFAYLRAQADKFWITCRNAIAADGYEPMLNFSTSERIYDHEFGADPIGGFSDAVGTKTTDLEAARPGLVRDYWRKPGWEVPEGTVGNSVGTPNAWPYTSPSAIVGAEDRGFHTNVNLDAGQYQQTAMGSFTTDQVAMVAPRGWLISTGSDTFNNILKFKSGYGSWGQFPLWALRNGVYADGLGEQGSGMGYQDDTILTWGNIEANADVLNKQGYDSSGNQMEPFDFTVHHYGGDGTYGQGLNLGPSGINQLGPGGAGVGNRGVRYSWTWCPGQGAMPCWDSYETFPELLPEYVAFGKETPQINPGYANWEDGTGDNRWTNKNSEAAFYGTEVWKDPWDTGSSTNWYQGATHGSNKWTQHYPQANPSPLWSPWPPDTSQNRTYRRSFWLMAGHGGLGNWDHLGSGHPAGFGQPKVSHRFALGFQSNWTEGEISDRRSTINRTYEPEFFGGTRSPEGSQDTGYSETRDWINMRTTGVHHPYGTVPHRLWDLPFDHASATWSFNSATDDPDAYEFRTEHIRNKDTVTNQTSYIGGCPNQAPAPSLGVSAYTTSDLEAPVYRYYVLTIPADPAAGLMG